LRQSWAFPGSPRRDGRRRAARAAAENDPVIPALMPNYTRADLAFARGEGAVLWTEDGRRFLDFGGGIATSSVGHGHPHLAKAIADQAAKVIHVSNLYRIPQAETLAARHVAQSFADSVFFCNSGAEANEGMVKAVRKYHSANGRPERFRMICFDGAFHGRTLAMIAATGNPKYLEGFGPPVDGFDHVPFGDMNAVRAASCAICAPPAMSSACCSPSMRCRSAWAARAGSGPMNGPGSSPTSCRRRRASAGASRLARCSRRKRSRST
jgi:acetylornithine/succinyldiaminopimelate/putrescine aminotransferase